MKFSYLFLLCLSLVSAASVAQTLQSGDTLAAFTVDNLGLLVLDGEDVMHEPFDSAKLKGRPTYLQHLAARVGVDGTYKPLSDELEKRQYSADVLNSVAIINRDDAAFGTGFIVTATLKSNKRRYPDANIVVDHDGQILEQWGLKPKGAAIVILDADGTILFFKEGALSPAEQAQVLDMLDQAINASQ